MLLDQKLIGERASTISSAMFGGNLLFKYDSIYNGDQAYSAIADALGISSMRYPGGTMTENNFDVNNPDNPPIGSDPKSPFVGITDFLNYAASAGRAVDIVLPTKGLYSGRLDASTDQPRSINEQFEADVLNYVRLLLTHGDADAKSLPDTPIATIEIGNEYWGGGKMTASEYGKAVNLLVPKIETLIDSLISTDSLRPKVIIQMGAPLDPQFTSGIYSGMSYSERLYQSNRNILNQITDPIAVAGVDGLVRHYYYSAESQYLEKNTWTMNSIDACFEIWANSGYGGRDYYITEWNVNFSNLSQLGLKGASVFIEQFAYMVDEGVDAAFAWPVKGYTNGLFQSGDIGIQLSPIGAAFKLMSESLVGTKLLPYGLENGPVNVEAYGSNSKVVIFISSRSDFHQSSAIDISEIVKEYHSVEGVRLGISQGSIATDLNAAAIISALSPGSILVDGELKFDLDPYEVLRISFEIPVGRQLDGSSGADKLQGGFGKDSIYGFFGSDTLFGDAGNDSVSAGMGNDLVSAGDGCDTVFGGMGGDRIAGGAGDDLLIGGQGNDLLMAVSGCDTMYGGDGNDTLFGGADGSFLHGRTGNDSIAGVEGNDTLNGGSGADTLIGGSGEDTFVFDISNQPYDLIKDFQHGIDTIQISRAAFAGLNLGILQDHQFHLAGSPSVGGVPSLVYSAHTGQVYFDRAGNGIDGSDRVVFQVLPDQVLTAIDFVIF